MFNSPREFFKDASPDIHAAAPAELGEAIYAETA
jgi:hypothetical protein